ncbi:MAG: heat-inducible transcription repressor HrcA [Erysipelotrichaceae bacterium]|nr:heat-inducible transcription repressor HrcA [Erysipelotrichaceae bacterium]
MLKSRMITIFKAIVDEFIATAEPVGSKTLMKKYNLPYSSATIRNDMQLLEEMGYLEKTHVSSGRVPSTLGYKFYCENLMEDNLDDNMAVALKSAIGSGKFDLHDAIQQSCDILADMTNLATGALGPDSKLQTLEHIKLFPVDERNAVVIFITNTGHTETKNFRFNEDVLAKDVQTVCDIINTRLKGTPVYELPVKFEAMKPILESIIYRHEIIFSAFLSAFIKFANENFHYSKTSNILYQPEYSDIEKIKELMSMLDDNTVWRRLGYNDENVGIVTATGSQLQWFDDVAVVKSSFKVNKLEEGKLMVVGPSRMDYSKIVAVLEYVTDMLERIYGQGGNDE